MADTLVTKLKATVNNSNLPLFGKIRINRKINASAAKIWGFNNTDEAEFYSPDGTLQYGTDEAAQTISVRLASTTYRSINYVDDTAEAIINTPLIIKGIEACIIPNEIELHNAPLEILKVNGNLNIGNLPSTIKEMIFGDSGNDRGNITGDLSDLKCTNIRQFISYANNFHLTGNLRTFAEKFDPTGFRGVGVDYTTIEGSLLDYKELLANSTYAAPSTATTSLSFYARNTPVTGSMDELITYLTGKVFSKKLGFAVKGSQITYQDLPISASNFYLIFDENGDPTVTTS